MEFSVELHTPVVIMHARCENAVFKVPTYMYAPFRDLHVLVMSILLSICNQYDSLSFLTD
jgi:hypothetical protein